MANRRKRKHKLQSNAHDLQLAQYAETPRPSINTIPSITIGSNLSFRTLLLVPAIICLILSGSMTHAQAATTDTATYLPTAYEGIKGRDITPLKPACEPIKMGLNHGIKCTYEDKLHFMKRGDADRTNDRLLEAYNQLLSRDYLDIPAPVSEFVYRDNVPYLSSEAMTGFNMAKSLKTEPLDRAVFRSRLVEKIGEQGIVKKTVAATLIGDLTTENWGFNDKGLVLVDVDGGKKKETRERIQPTTLEGYLKMTRNLLQFDRSRLKLSLSNLIEMEKIYNNLKTKPAPKLHPSVDMPESLYQDIMNTYAKMCKDTIAFIQTNYPTLDPAMPDEAINQELGYCAQREIDELTAQINFEIPLDETKEELRTGTIAGSTTATIQNILRYKRNEAAINNLSTSSANQPSGDHINKFTKMNPVRELESWPVVPLVGGIVGSILSLGMLAFKTCRRKKAKPEATEIREHRVREILIKRA